MIVGIDNAGRRRTWPTRATIPASWVVITGDRGGDDGVMMMMVVQDAFPD